MSEDSKISSKDEIETLIKACYTLIYIGSAEEKRVEDSIRDISLSRKRKFISWTVTEGFIGGQVGGQSESYKDITDPMRALEFISKYEDDAIFVLKDFHPFLGDFTIVRKLRDLGRDLKKTHKTVIILAAVVKIPMEIEKEIALTFYDLPTRVYIDGIITKISRTISDPSKCKAIGDAESRERVVEAALGLTAEEAESVFSKSLVLRKDFDIETILNEKKHIIRKSGMLEFFETNERFDDVGGLDILKSWLSKRLLSFSQKARDFGLPQPKGILLIGIPGCGKSLTAKAIGAAWKLPLLRLDVGKIFASLVGSSEENIRRCIALAESIAPSILWLDELEKGFSGAKSSGFTDGGTTSRVFSTFITWLQEKTSPVFVIATANDVSMLPPELLRKGRFDEIFFVDLPSPDERKAIVKIHLRKKKRDIDKFDLDKIVASTQGFSGSEIEQTIVSALYDAFDEKRDIDTDSIIYSAQEMIPLSYTMKETIDALRDWAKTRARNASVNIHLKDKGSDIRRIEFEAVEE